MSETEQLVKMANQIADNFSFHDGPAAFVADHMQRFWAPSMRQKLVELSNQEEHGLNAVARDAARRLQKT
jgi:formate dehydrogenase subunit delta